MSANSHLSFLKRSQIGCVAGLVGGFAIFVSIFVIDLGLGASQGTFYKVVGLAAGMTGIESTLFGMVSHMLTAALIGTIFGFVSGAHKKLDILSLRKGAIIGTITGIAVFSIFFVPISTTLMIPLIQSSNASLAETAGLLSNMDVIMIGSIELHIVFGVVMGTFFAIGIQYETKKMISQTAVV
jgi:hypothetical protein